MNNASDDFLKKLNEIVDDVVLTNSDKLQILHKWHDKIVNLAHQVTYPEDIYNVAHVHAHIKILIQKVEKNV